MRDLSPSASFVFENGINEVYPTGIPLDFFDFRLSYAKETIDPDKCGLPLPPETIDVFLNYQRYLVHCREYGHDPLIFPRTSLISVIVLSLGIYSMKMIFSGFGNAR